MKTIVDHQLIIQAVCNLAGVANIDELNERARRTYVLTGSAPKYVLIPQIEINGLQIKFDEDIVKPCIQTKKNHRVDL